MYYIFKQKHTYKLDENNNTTSEIESTSYTFIRKMRTNSRPRGSHISIQSFDDYVSPDLAYVDNNYVLSENTQRKDTKELKIKKIQDAKDRMKVLDTSNFPQDVASVFDDLKMILNG